MSNTFREKLAQIKQEAQRRVDEVASKLRKEQKTESDGIQKDKPGRKKSNLFAYGAIAVAAAFALSFFSGPKVPEPDRSNLSEEDGVVTFKVPRSFTDVRTDLLEAEEEVASGAEGHGSSTNDSISDSTNPAGETASLEDASAIAVSVPAEPGSGEPSTTPPDTAAQADAATATPSPSPTPDAILAGTSAEGARLPSMFSPSAKEEPVKQMPRLMVPVESASEQHDSRETTDAPAEPDLDSLQLRADRGDPDAMFEIAMNSSGQSDPESQKIRFRYMQAAAQKGSVPAMREVAGLHERGEGVLPSTRMAYVWSTLATAFGEDMSGFRERLAAKMSVDEMQSAQRAAAATLNGLGAYAMDKAKSYKSTLSSSQ